MVQTRGNTVLGIVAIECQNESYEIILKPIWGTVMNFNFQFKIKSVKKYRKTMVGKIFMVSHLRFSRCNIAFGVLSWIHQQS